MAKWFESGIKPLTASFPRLIFLTFQKANNISPTATWVFVNKDESTQNYSWELREDNQAGRIASAIYAVKQNAFIVFTEADNQRAKNASTEKASGL